MAETIHEIVEENLENREIDEQKVEGKDDDKNIEKTVQTEVKRIEADFKTEDFIVTDLEDDNHSIGDDLEIHQAPEPSSKEIVQTKEIIDTEITVDKQAVEVDLSSKKKTAADEDEFKSDFFEKTVDIDAEKKKVLTGIAGMTEISEVSTDHIEETPSVRFSKVMQTPDKAAESTLTLDETTNQLDDKVSTVSSKDTSFDLTSRGKSIDTAALLGSSATISSPEDQLKVIQAMETKRKPRKTSYNFGPRIRSLSEEDIYEGFDMTPDTHEIYFGDIQEEEEESIVEEEEKQSILDRTPYYEKHDKLAEEISVAKIRNYILHKKLSMYFKRKKMDDVTRETEVSYDSINKYYKKLMAYGELIELVKEEKSKTSGEIDLAKKQKEQKAKELEELFTKMLNREAEVGYGLILSKTGNIIPDKHVERLLSRQSKQMNQVSFMRLNFIKLKGMVQEKLDAIDTLDEIAPGLLLADYEQLKIDNRSHADKIEEKDEELTRLRIKCANSIQVLAHLKEKSSALENDLLDLNWERTNVEHEYQDVRGRLNDLKQSRDYYRNRITKLRDSSGLLTQPALLRDMEQAMRNIEKESEHLQHIKDEYKRRAQQIKAVRKKIENANEIRKNVIKKSAIRLKSNMKIRSSVECVKPMVYKSRPTLFIPTIENSTFEELKAIAPKVTYNRSRKKTQKLFVKRKGE